MKLAFCLFKYTPFGGLERDFLRILETAIEHKHKVCVYVQEWQGNIPPALKHFVEIIPHSIFAISNHARVQDYVDKLSMILKHQSYDCVIGFNRLPHLDFYFASDSCYREESQKKHGKWYTFLPRYKIFSQIEQAVFSDKSKTKILLLNHEHEKEYVKHYHTSHERFFYLFPGIGNDRKKPDAQMSIRKTFRQKENIHPHEKIILMVCSNFKIKGAERTLHAIASLSKSLQNETYLWIVGNGNQSNIKHLTSLAKKLNLDLNRIKFYGAREDVVNFYAAADILMHPAILETAGMVLLEALVATLPIIVTSNCGYATYIQQAKAGIILYEPFQQTQLNSALHELLNSNEKRETYKNNALEFTKLNNLFRLNEQVLEIIENV